jgi:hypothetical protein
MSPQAQEILNTITEKAGDGNCPQGFDLFPSSLVLRNEDLHQNYTWESAVLYLMRLLPGDASDIERETSVEQWSNDSPTREAAEMPGPQ